MILITVLLFLSAVWALSIPNTDIAPRTNADDAAPGPFTTSSRWILDANGKRFKMRCVHWVAHMEVNVPEGLQHQSMDHISSWIAKNNFNCVRLSYSIDMALNPNQVVNDSFNAAAGLTGAKPEDMAALYKNVTMNNPSVTATTTVINVFEQVIASLNSHGIKTILDNHVSKASWCCNLTDGNGWFDVPGSIPVPNTKYFDIDNWLKGLAFMATFSKGKAGVVGMDLRNEMRPILRDTDNWYKYIPQGLDAIHGANPVSSPPPFDTSFEFLGHMLHGLGRPVGPIPNASTLPHHPPKDPTSRDHADSEPPTRTSSSSLAACPLPQTWHSSTTPR